jgi:putative membrane protein
MVMKIHSLKFHSLKSAAVVAGTLCIPMAVLSAQSATEPSTTQSGLSTPAQDSIRDAQTGRPGTSTYPSGTMGGSGSGATDGSTPGAASGSTSGAPAGTTPGATSGGTTGSASAAQSTYSDAEILAVVNAVDRHEIAAAAVALKKDMKPEAKAFAKMLRKEHDANQSKTKKLGKRLDIKPASSATSDSLVAKGAREMADLTVKTGQEFEKAYIDAMVQGHDEALQMLDTQLIPSAKNDAVKTHLGEVRGHIASHLEQAKRLQGAQAAAPVQ